MDVYRDPGLLWLDEDLEPDGQQPELLTAGAGLIWWSAADATADIDFD